MTSASSTADQISSRWSCILNDLADIPQLQVIYVLLSFCQQLTRPFILIQTTLAIPL
jgi:hypothetical protein